MISKILITVLVILGAIIVLRKRYVQVSPPANKKSVESANEEMPVIKIIAYAIVSITLLTGISFSIFDWMDDHKEYQIRIVNPQTGKAEIYSAYKKDLKGRSFTTLTGQQITVSDLERIEFVEAE